jgi:hypothetical protein
MVKILKAILITTIIISNITDIIAQELRSLSRNQVVINAIEKKGFITTLRTKAARVAPVVLQLPFFEDFSDYGPLPLVWPFPKSEKWSDSYAFINSEFPDSMISIGVATLDAFDQNGFPYSITKADSGFSDTLTSNYFNITTGPGNIYLSFFYEAGGKGEMPDLEDSLFVDFYTPKCKWVNVWQIQGGQEQHVFTQQTILVPDSLQKDSLRFRFRNHTSISDKEKEKESNVDQWHLDYIQLNRTSKPDTLAYLNDAMVIQTLLPSIKEYCSVPYHHLDMARASSERTNTDFVIRTYYPQKLDLLEVTRFHSSFDVENNKLKERPGNGGIANTVNPVEINSFPDLFAADMSYNPASKSGKLELLSYFNINDPYQRTVNDTLRRTEYYADYYAYDDGSAEFGFGNSGGSGDMFFIANRYRIFRRAENPDTLKAVYIYFNKPEYIGDDTVEFKVCVWKNDGLLPGEFLYESSDYLKPDYSKRINEFIRYELETPLLVSDTIFVGIRQNTSAFINIGYDRNNNSRDNIYVKTDASGWYNPYSKPTGSLMIRPSFGAQDIVLATDQPSLEQQIGIYPNPANDFVNLRLPDELNNKPLKIQVINIMGLTQINTTTENYSIDISALQTGIYFIVVSSTEGNFRTTNKFLKN